MNYSLTFSQVKRVFPHNLIVTIYFKKRIEELIKFTSPSYSDIILDFGTGGKLLQQLYPQFKIICYDINPLWSDVDNYSNVSPSIIIASHIFEHVEIGVLLEILNNFKKIDFKKLIVALPIEPLFVKILNPILEKPKAHILCYKCIHKILEQYFVLRRMQSVWKMTIMTEWVKK